MVSRDFRELLAEILVRGLRFWGISEEVVTSDAVREAVYLADEATLLAASGLALGPEKAQIISQLLQCLQHESAARAIVEAGDRLDVRELAGAVAEALGELQESLLQRGSLGRLGQATRALPLLGVSAYSSQGAQLGAALGGESRPAEQVRKYAQAFCGRDTGVLAAVDRAVIEEPQLGPLVLEVSSRLLRQVTRRSTPLSEEARGPLFTCLAFLVRQAVAGASGADALATERRMEADEHS